MFVRTLSKDSQLSCEFFSAGQFVQGNRIIRFRGHIPNRYPTKRIGKSVRMGRKTDDG